MRKKVLFPCIAAALLAFGGCAGKKETADSSSEAVSESQAETAAVIEAATEPESQPETVPPRKKVEESDYFGKWVTKKMVVNEEVYDDFYMDLELEYLFQLEINEDGTAVMGNAIPDSEKKAYNWLFISGMIEMNGESDCSVYGSMPYEDLILTDGEGIKLYMERTDEFRELSELNYETAIEYNGDIELPELNIEKTEVSPSAYLGKWECNFHEIDDVVYREEMYDIPLNAIFRMEFTSDGKAQFIVGGGDEDAVITDYTWELYPNGCAGLMEDGESVGIIRIKNDTLYLDEGNTISHFSKVDEFTDFDWSALAE